MINLSEQEIKNQILEVLLLKGYFVFPIDSVGIYDSVKKCYRKKRSKFHIRGVSDILGADNKGRIIAIEVKSKTGRPTLEQLKFLFEVNQRGGFALVARSVEQVLTELDSYEKRNK